MKKYRIEVKDSLDRKIDVREAVVDGDKMVVGDVWVTATIQIVDKMRTFMIPREQVKIIEVLNE